MWSKKQTRVFVYIWAFLALLFIVCAAIGQSYAADLVPREATKHRLELTRAAHQTWGLNAPIPVFAAQIQQESAWNSQATSPVGAIGMAQFMPATASWWCSLNSLSAIQCQPNNPQWAMQALVGYDKWLYERTWGLSEYDRMHAVLRAYNGGLGHWQREALLAAANKRATREQVDAMCGKVKRHISFCPENLNYPRRILNVYQPRYVGWGRRVMMTGGAA